MADNKDFEQIGFLENQQNNAENSGAKKRKIKNDIITQVPVGNIIEKTVEDIMHTSMMPYSEYVIMDRALPRIEDGLKPVQRRILFTMLELGVFPDKPYKKSARIVGDCLGKYHPHSDTSVYDAMVRLAQDFNMSNILVKGQGNFGSIDGDPAAAMRYTEVKLSDLAMELMRDLDKDTVTYSFNFDDTLKEPDYFTGRFPNLLVNGATGIAVGLATNIPPHNLNEVIDAVVEYIENKNCTVDDLLKHIKGPDFPTGATIEKSQDMIDAYKTGKGRVVMRANFHTEELPNGKTNIIITQLPYQVNKSEFLQKILAVKDKVKGELNNITEILDESDKNGMRAVITVKKDANVSNVINLLLKNTDMEKAFNYNCVVIAKGKPMQMTLLDIIRYYVEFQVDVIYKRTKFDLEKAKARAHIVKGLVIAIENIDEVIKIIKSSMSTTQAKERLMNTFDLSDAQATAILDMRLSRLTNLETSKLKEELAQLEKLIAELTGILASKTRQFNVVKKEILDIKKRFDTPRRTKVVNNFTQFKLTQSKQAQCSSECFVALSFDGLRLKNIAINSVMGVDNSFKNYNSTNVLHLQTLKTTTDSTLLAFTDLGNIYKFKAADIPECKFNTKGAPFNQIVKAELDEKIVSIFDYAEIEAGGQIYFFTQDGFIKKTEASEYKISKFSAAALRLKEKDKVTTVQSDFKLPSVLLVTKRGMVLNCELKDVPLQKRAGGGVIGISLNNNDSVVFASQVNINDKMLVVTNKSNAKRVNLTEFAISARNRKGLKVLPQDETVCFVASPVVSGEVVLQDHKDNLNFIDVSKIEVVGRMAAGKPILKNKSNKIKICTIYLN